MKKFICKVCSTDLKKGIDNNVKRAVKIRLEKILEEQQASYQHYLTKIKPKGLISPSKQAIIERAHKKKISALRIVIYICTPNMERDSDIPNLF